MDVNSVNSKIRKLIKILIWNGIYPSTISKWHDKQQMKAKQLHLHQNIFSLGFTIDKKKNIRNR
jgi:hypothetical protein